MRRKKSELAPTTLTPQRAARLYRLLTHLSEGPQTRRRLLTRLKVDIRGFYRDLESLRGLGIDIVCGLDNKYLLVGTLDSALARLPFPDPGLNVRDALQLANGSSPAHRKLRQRVNTFLYGNSSQRTGGPNKPR
jgi:predicted DNA-binding transcriptional regulator YafY